MSIITLTNASLPAKRRIMTTCVQLFLEKGYKKTTLAEIIEKAEVSYSTFQNIFRAKDGVLTELLHFMYESQFTMARTATAALPPIYVYALETAIQLTVTELNENIREIYIEAYTQKECLDYIQHETAKELHQIFGKYQPELTEYDFYLLDLGSSGIMRGYMIHPCDGDFPLEKKLRIFITMTLQAFCVPDEEIAGVLQFIAGVNIRELSEQVLHKLFNALAMHYEFSLPEVGNNPQ